MELKPGTRLGAYEIRAALGSGGMGDVYSAHDARLERDVAIKVLPGGFSSDPMRLARFEREVKAVAALSHPHIMAIHDFGSQDGCVYAVMELLDGQTLRERLASGRLAARKVAELGAQIARGLAAAHDKGIVHRDLKPENVFVSADGTGKILDFGLARQDKPLAPSDATGTVGARPTEPGTVLGTFPYMSPEQVRGQPVDHRSDIFSLGALLYEMAYGRHAFLRATQAETTAAILRDEPGSDPAREGVPATLEHIIRHCLEKLPAERFQSARDLAFQLEAAVAPSTTILAAAPAALGPDRRRLLRGAAAAGVTVLAFVAGWAARAGRAPAPAQQASFSQVTDFPGLEGEADLAPDGSVVAYVSDAAGNHDVYVLRIGGSKPIGLTLDSQADDNAPAFSPDGTRIAFRSERDGGGVFVMGATGESVRRITDFGYDPAWSPDGQQLVVAEEPVRDPMRRTGVSRLFAVSASGEGKRALGAGDAVGPKWSPHGQRIAYWGVRQPGWVRDLWTVAADGSDPVALTDDPFIDWSPEWSPDGRFLYFASNRGGSMNLWRVPIDERSGRPLGSPEPVPVPAGWAGGVSLAAGRLVFGSREWRSDAWRTSFDPDAEALVGAPAPVLRGQALDSLDWSPDGRTLVFARRGLPWESLGLVHADGGGYVQLSDAGSQHREPRFSPDGSRFVFRSTRGGTPQLWTMRPDGSGVQQVSQGAGDPIYPVWSPDGNRIAAGGIDATLVFDLTRPLPTEPVEKLPLTDLGLPIDPWSWSPDGRWLVGYPGKLTNGLYLYSFEDRSYRKLDNSGEQAIFLPDSRRLLCTKDGGLLVLDTTSGRRRPLLPPHSLEPGNWGVRISLSRDGRSLGYLEARREGNLWLAQLDAGAPAP